MTEKNEYIQARINLVLFVRQDIITASGDDILGSEGADDRGWTTNNKEV